ncbi:unnamed protein product [Rodentolepis nana]|uniref:LAM_G_DOMAIN domain-containing protein n=1 Tax=Rodentolepis nana TaxID=102285 RepID=A0A0R3TQV0_RODNA|nr:unnamed protein product [Rodentolepis nana]
MPTGRVGSGAVNVPDLGVLVLGGRGADKKVLNVVELFQSFAGKSTWCSFTPMLAARNRPVVEFFQGCVYVAGSRDTSPHTAEFLSITNGRQGGNLYSMQAVRDHLYVVAKGGNVYELEMPHEENDGNQNDHSWRLRFQVKSGLNLRLLKVLVNA